MNNKLELTWIGKYKQKNLEPRLLIEDESKSYGNKENENMLIHGDNLLALKALENEFTNKIKCVYIDPPFNTGARINAEGEEVGYDDGLEHSIWLEMMKARFDIIRNLLTEDGTLIVHLDDREGAYCKVLLDEVFGRYNYINTITMTTNEPSGFKATGSKIFSTSNILLIYGKSKEKTQINKIYIKKEYDKAYSKIFTKKEGNYKEWEWTNIKDYVCMKKGYESIKEAVKENGNDVIDSWIKECALENYKNVFRTAAIGGGAKKKRIKTIEYSAKHKDEIFVYENEDVKDFYILNGEQIVFYKNRFKEIDGILQPSQTITDVWTDISWTGIASEGKVVFKNSKKPEMLLKRVLDIFTEEGDIVLDSFLGSGTTCAVAHKMNRRWIGIEMAEHCYSHCKKRLDFVIDGDTTGISKIVKWNGGGGYKFYELAPSLINYDLFGEPVINKKYNAEMLASAIALHEGFKYCPSNEFYWKQSVGNENSYLYVTTQYIDKNVLQNILNELKENEYLIIACTSFDNNIDGVFKNIKIKKIPEMLLKKCEFGREDYNLNIINPPEYYEDIEENEEDE